MPNNHKIRLEPPPSPAPPSYEVGYRKPPAATQFKPGRSGNPKGRPKGARNKRLALNEERLKTIIVDEAYRTIKVSFTGPEPLPHPDDIIIDMKTSQVIIKGPMTKEEKVLWDRMRARRDECDREIDELSAMLKDRKNKRFQHLIEDDIAHEKRLREIIVNAIGEWPKRDGFAK